MVKHLLFFGPPGSSWQLLAAGGSSWQLLAAPIDQRPSTIRLLDARELQGIVFGGIGWPAAATLGDVSAAVVALVCRDMLTPKMRRGREREI